MVHAVDQMATPISTRRWICESVRDSWMRGTIWQFHKVDDGLITSPFQRFCKIILIMTFFLGEISLTNHHNFRSSLCNEIT